MKCCLKKSIKITSFNVEVLMLIKAAFLTGVLLYEKIKSYAIYQMKAIEGLMFIGNGRIGTCTSL